jgi:hypothetical protein
MVLALKLGLTVGASLQNSKLHKISAKSKTQLALLGSCISGTVGHLLRPKNLDTTSSLQRMPSGSLGGRRV